MNSLQCFLVNYGCLSYEKPWNIDNGLGYCQCSSLHRPLLVNSGDQQPLCLCTIARPLIGISLLEVELDLPNGERGEPRPHAERRPQRPRTARQQGVSHQGQNLSSVVDVPGIGKEWPRVEPPYVLGSTFPEMALKLRPEIHPGACHQG